MNAASKRRVLLLFTGTISAIAAKPLAARSAPCASLYGQCGGHRWSGPTCCAEGGVCTVGNKWYSQCKPGTSDDGNDECAPLYGQCGGRGWTGPTCCGQGAGCTFDNNWYSQCRPSAAPTPAPTAEPSTAAPTTSTEAETATTSSTAAPTTTTSAASGSGCCAWGDGSECGALCGSDGSSWCHASAANCAACTGTTFLSGRTATDTDGTCGGGGGGTGGGGGGGDGGADCTLPGGLDASAPAVDNTGFAKRHGALQLDGVQLVDQSGSPVQLMGMSSHGLHWFPDCYTKASIQYLVETWGINVFRAAMYVGENGFASDPSVEQRVHDIVQWTDELGIYVVIDWHVLTPGNPNAATYAAADDFFARAAARYADRTHVLYETANEPNGVGWAEVKRYHDRVIPVIRQHDPDAIIIAGTPTWSQDIHLAAADPVAMPHHVMYGFHQYAGTHASLRARVAEYATRIPIFMSEWGTSTANGNGGVYLEESLAWLELVADASGVKISWAQWSYADKAESSAALLPGACASQAWGQTSCSGTFLAAYIKANVAVE